MTIDGTKLKKLRIQRGLSQERLGLLTNLNKRTIQRAEGGNPVALETVAFIAEALEVEPKQLRGHQLELFSTEDTPQATERGEIVLLPVSKGSRLVNALRDAFSASFDYQAEPNEENQAVLEELAEVFNSAWISPWQTPDIDWDNTSAVEQDKERIRLQVRANKVLPELLDQGVRIFIGSYPSWQQIPSYDMDEGFMSVRMTQPKKPVTNVIVVVSDEEAKHLSRMPSDHEVHTAPNRQTVKTDLDEEIPF